MSINLEKIVSSAVQSATQQTVARAAEAVTKMATEGASKFTSAFNGTNIIPADGQSILRQSSTGEIVGAIGQSNQSLVPANLVPGNSTSNITKLQTGELKVRISQYPVFGNLLGELIFDVMPQIDESRQIDYDALQLVHHPGVIQKYKSTGARTWSVRGKLITRNRVEATKNLDILNMIRAWSMPYYGEGTAQNPMVSQYLGAPPPILTLSAYGPKTIGPLKCVLTNYSWDWPNDIDWLPTVEGTPFPVLMNVSLSLTETWSPDEFSGFDIIKYRNGELPSAFDGSVARSATSTGRQSASSAGSNSNVSLSEPSSTTPAQAKTTPIRQFNSVDHAKQYLESLGQKITVPTPSYPTSQQLRDAK